MSALSGAPLFKTRQDTCNLRQKRAAVNIVMFNYNLSSLTRSKSNFYGTSVGAGELYVQNRGFGKFWSGLEI